jgi:protein disulfide-isomerase
MKIVPCILSLMLSLPLAASVYWSADYDQAFIEAQVSKKSLVVLFTSSDSCIWCKKFEEEVFEDQDFINGTSSLFHFVKVDLPKYADIEAKNLKLKEEFDIRSYPTLLLLDDKGQKIATLGYQKGGGKKYASYLIKLADEYSEYQYMLTQAQKRRLRSTDLEALYNKARELGQSDDIQAILTAGVASDDKRFFLKEKYRFLVESGNFDSNEANGMRMQLKTLDPDNAKGIHYDLAVIDYQNRAERALEDSLSAEEICTPLLNYVAYFSEKDEENIWRLQMIIAQTFLDKKIFSKALHHAKESYIHAPSHMKGDISHAIVAIKEEMKRSGRG